MKARALPPDAVPSPQAPPGRWCARSGCFTILSVYNRSQFCYTHRPADPPTVRQRRDLDYASHGTYTMKKRGCMCNVCREGVNIARE